MPPDEYQLAWQGPFAWIGDREQCIFDSPVGKEHGLYLWTIAYDSAYLVYYVGETGRSFEERLWEHTKEYLSGVYRVYDPALFRTGRRSLTWPGLWMKGTKDNKGEFLRRYHELTPIIYDLLTCFHLFVAPLRVERRVRQRIEAALLQQLYAAPDPIGHFVDEANRNWPRRRSETPFSVEITAEASLIGIPQHTEA